MRRERCRSIFVWCWLGLLGLIGGSRFVGGLAWPLDLAANLSYFIAVPALATVAVSAITRQRRAAIASALICICAIWPMLPLDRQPVRQTQPGVAAVSGAGGSLSIRLLVANIRESSESLDRVLAILDREEPDVVALIECSMDMAASLVKSERLRGSGYRYTAFPQRGQQWPVLLLSRWPMYRLDFLSPALHVDSVDSAAVEQRYRSVYAFRRSYRIDVSDEGEDEDEDEETRSFVFTAVHAPSPRTALSWANGNETVRLLCEVIGEYLVQTRLPIVIASDLNSTPSGFRFRYMQRNSGLHSSANAAGVPIGTWPSDWPGLLRLPIDQAWGSRQVDFVERRVLEQIGSDHRPLLLTMQITYP